MLDVGALIHVKIGKQVTVFEINFIIILQINLPLASVRICNILPFIYLVDGYEKVL